MIEHLRGRNRKLEPLGWTGRHAEWITLVCLHSGVFMRAQFCHYFNAQRMTASRFVNALVDRRIAVEGEWPLFNGGGKTCRISSHAHLKDIYEAHHNDPDLLSLHKEIALCDTRIEDLLTQISGRMGDCIDQVSAAFSAFQKAHAADELSGEVGDLGSAIHRLKEDRSTWPEIREEQKNKARLVGGDGPLHRASWRRQY